MDIKVINSGVFSVNTVIVPLCQNKVFVVDPAACSLSGDSDIITGFLRKNALECFAVVLTHSHFDHITGIDLIKKDFPNAKIAIHKAEAQELINPPGPMGESVISFFGLSAILPYVARQPKPDLLLEHGNMLDLLLSSDELSSCNSSDKTSSDELFKALSSWKVLHTPGHTPGSICLYNQKENILISGDTLFEDGWGRTDMYGGDEKEIMKSLGYLRDKIPSGTKVYPGHDSFCFLMG